MEEPAKSRVLLTDEEKHAQRLAKQREYQRQRYAENPEAERARKRRSYTTHAEKERARTRRYALNNPERVRAWRTSHAGEARQWQIANPEKRRAIRRRWYNNHIEERRKHARQYGLQSRKVITAIIRRYRQRYPEKHRARVATYKARKRGAARNDLTAAQWAQIKAYFGFRCAYCDREIEPLTMDHITPLSKGGSHTVSNIVPACRSCNSKKGTGEPLRPVQPLLLTTVAG